MKRRNLWIVVFAAPLALLALLVSSGLLFGYFMSRATPYCPRAHKIRDLAVCQVLDERNGARLIQHADLDINETYTEIQTKTTSQVFESPQFGPNAHILDDVKLLDSQTGTISINGQHHVLQPIAGRTF